MARVRHSPSAGPHKIGERQVVREHRLTNDPRFSSEVLVSPRQRLGTGRRRRTAGYGAVTGWRVVDLAGSSFPQRGTNFRMRTRPGADCLAE